jgi:hypothetical protein
MTCNEARKRLAAAPPGSVEGELLDHVHGCAGCRRYHDRVLAAGRWFREHRAEVLPDAAFAARVSARLGPSGSADALGWAAVRLLPAVLALVVVLGWFAFQTSPDLTATSSEAADDDLLTWLIEQDGTEP